MSYSHTQRKKEKKRTRTPEERSVASKIRKGTFPKLFFVKTGDSHLERQKAPGERRASLTWATRSAYHELTKKELK